MTDTLYIDTETFSPVPLASGTYAYADFAEVVLVAWALGDGPVSVWDVTAEPPPVAFRQAWEDEHTPVVAHNVGFDRTVVMRSPTWPLSVPALHRWHCTMARAHAHGLPGGLELLGRIYALPEDKQKRDGKALARLFTRLWDEKGKSVRYTRETHPAEWQDFIYYAAHDVEAMRELHRRLPSWNLATERPTWELDQIINARGFAVDVPLAQAAVALRKTELARLADNAQSLTEGALGATTQRDKLLGYLLSSHGVTLPDLQASTLEARLQDDSLPAPVRELIANRLQASMASVGKYQRVLSGVNADGRLRGTLQYCGASRTGRWAGRLFQPQNLPRPNLPAEAIELGIEAIKVGCADLFTDNPLSLASNALRGLIVAAPGRCLAVADLSNIEGRVLAWLAGEQWKLDAFAAFDAGQGEDLYRLAYARAFRQPVATVTPEQRQIGKVLELSMGYAGGVSAFVSMAANYGIDLQALTDRVRGTLPTNTVAEATAFLDRRVGETGSEDKATFGLGREVFVACDCLKRLWREAHPRIVRLWDDVETAAVADYGSVGLLRFRTEGAWLLIQLPSGRELCYPNFKDLSYAGTNPYTKKWGRVKTYGGKLVENITQAAARDVLVHGMHQAERAELRIVLTVHDEVLAEATDAKHAERLAGCLTRPIDWSSGLPLAAHGFVCHRYRKD